MKRNLIRLLNLGRIRTISFYNREVPFAQIVKPFATMGNLDRYFIYLLDSHEHLAPVLSLFTVYFDYRYYAHIGEYVSKNSTYVGASYSYNLLLFFVVM